MEELAGLVSLGTEAFVFVPCKSIEVLGAEDISAPLLRDQLTSKGLMTENEKVLSLWMEGLGRGRFFPQSQLHLF